MTLLYLLLWLITFEAMTWAVLPITALAMPGRLATALAIARPLGFLAVGWIAWAVPASGLLPFSGPTVGIALVNLAVAAYLFLPGRDELFARLRRERRDATLASALYLGVFTIFAVFRACQAEIFWGEKPMDFTLLNYFVRLEAFPVEDPWAAGQLMRYYYLGTYLFAAILKLTGIPTNVGYNLALATLPALIVSAAYGAGLQITRRKTSAAIGALALVLLGNIEGGLLALSGKTIDFNSFWATSRVLKSAMANEYPLWAFLFADLHAHVISLAFTTALVALGIRFLSTSDLRSSRASMLAHRGLFALAWGCLLPCNAWDFLSYGLFTFLLLVVFRPECGKRRLVEPIAVGLAALAFASPFLRTLFSGPPAGHGFERYGFNEAHQVLRHLGQFIVPVVSVSVLLVSRAWRPGRRRRQKGARVRAAIAGIFAVVPVAGGCYTMAATMAWGILALAGGIAGLGAAVALAPGARLRHRALGTFSAAAGWLIAAAELIWLVDRMNTIFKIYSAIWTLLGLALLASLPELIAWAKLGARRLRTSSGWVVRGPAKCPPVPRIGTLLPAIAIPLALLAGIAGAVHAISVMTTYHRVEGPRFTLDGTAYLERVDPNSKRLFDWMTANVTGLPVVLEAHGESYAAFTRVSMHTGLPTVLGWEHHVKQRGTPDWEVDRRRSNIDRIYSGESRPEAVTLLKQYRVRYVVVGTLERRRYSGFGLVKFGNNDSFREVFRSGAEVLYEVVARD